MKKIKFTLNKNYYTYIYKWETKNCDAVVQIVHGSKEHPLRYLSFAKFLNEQNISVYISDLRGHGISAQEQNQLGHISDKDGDINIIMDIQKITKLIKKQHPQVPYILIGHSMGSFIARKYAMLNQDADKYIFIGTNNKSFVSLIPAFAVIQITKLFKGKQNNNHLLDHLSYKAFEKKFVNQKGTWTTSDESQIKKDQKDDLFGISLSNETFYNILKWVGYISKSKNIKNHHDVPTLFLSGAEDSVGRFGKDITTIVRKYQKVKKNVKSIVYKGMRHEILNETKKFLVYDDILKFINTKVK